MGRGPRYNVAFARRRLKLTDYRARKAMILSDLPRLVIRSSLNYVNAQLAESEVEGDKITVMASSRELEKFGWQASYGNISAAYLTGLLVGKRAITAGVENAILDIGLRRASRGAKVFAALKGAVDAGLSVSHNEQVLPSEERIKGEHVVSYATKMSEENQQNFEKHFSGYLSRGLDPKQLTVHFLQVKDNILASFKSG